MNQRNPRSITRLRILDEAHTMLLTNGLPEALNVRLADVLSRLGLTTGAAYNIWDSQTHFREDLIVYMASHQAPPAGRDDTSIFARIEDDDLDEVAAAAALLIHCIRRADAAPDQALNFYFASIREPSPELAAAIDDAQRQTLAHSTSAIEAWMDRFERQPLPPHSAETLAVLARSASEGLLLRMRFEPEAVDLDGDAAPVRALAEALVALSQPRSHAA